MRHRIAVDKVKWTVGGRSERILPMKCNPVKPTFACDPARGAKCLATQVDGSHTVELAGKRERLVTGSTANVEDRTKPSRRCVCENFRDLDITFLLDPSERVWIRAD
jgi:hypothetical protein